MSDMTDTEVYMMLKFYHDLGHLYYRGESDTSDEKALKDVIFMDLRWLLQVFVRFVAVQEQVSILGIMNGHITKGGGLRGTFSCFGRNNLMERT